MRRGRWAFLAIPIVGIGLAFAFGGGDEFVGLGEPIDQAAIPALVRLPPSIQMSLVEIDPRLRTRAWRVKDSATWALWRLGRAGFSPAGGSSASVGGVETFEVERREFVNEDTGVRATVIQSSGLPGDVGCLAVVQEPVGLSAAWRKFRNRIRKALFGSGP